MRRRKSGKSSIGRFVAGALLALGLATPGLAVAATHGHKARLHGVVDRLTYDSLGRIDGFILKDKTFVRFHPASLEFDSGLKAGVVVSVLGTQVLAKPNAVLELPEVRAGKEIIVDEAKANKKELPITMPSASEAPQADSKIVFKDQSSLFVVGADSDGQINRLVLADGVSVQVPHDAKVDLSNAPLGETLSVFGVTTAISGERFAIALSLLNESKAELLQPRAGIGGKWMVIQGAVKQLKTDAKGDAQGVLLTNGTSVQFATTLFRLGAVSRLTPDTVIQAAGPMSGSQMFSEIVIVPADNTVIDTGAKFLGLHGGRHGH